MRTVGDEVKKKVAKKIADRAKKDAFSSFPVQMAVETAVELAADKLSFTIAEARESDCDRVKILIGQGASEMLVWYASKIESLARYLQNNPEKWGELISC